MNDVAVKNILTQILEKKDNKDLSIFQGLKEYKKYYITEQLPGRGPSSMSSMSAGGTGGNVKSGSVSFGGGAGVGLASPRPRRKDLDPMISGEVGGLGDAAEYIAYSKAAKGVGDLTKVLGAGMGGKMLGKFGPGIAGIASSQLMKSLGGFGADVAQNISDVLGGSIATANLNIGRRNLEAIASLAPRNVILPGAPQEQQVLSPEEERRKLLQQKIQDAELAQKASALGIAIP